jgi:uncharacterized protein YbjT (DUF2867 family)
MESVTMILVFAAGGPTGSAVVHSLSKRGEQVRGFVRNNIGDSAARKAGAKETVIGDLLDTQSIEAATKGVTGIFHIAPAFMSEESSIGRLIIDIACQNNIKKFVYCSVLHSIESKMLHHKAKRQVEAALLKTNLDFTILQPAMFMQNILLEWENIVNRGIYQGMFSPDCLISQVDWEDVAEVAAIALTTNDYRYATFELCAEGMMTRHQMANTVSEVLKKPIRATTILFDDWKPAALMGPYQREAMSRMFKYYSAHGFVGGNGKVLRAILGREPATFRVFVERIVNQRKQN